MKFSDRFIINHDITPCPTLLPTRAFLSQTGAKVLDALSHKRFPGSWTLENGHNFRITVRVCALGARLFDSSRLNTRSLIVSNLRY